VVETASENTKVIADLPTFFLLKTKNHETTNRLKEVMRLKIGIKN